MTNKKNTCKKRADFVRHSVASFHYSPERDLKMKFKYVFGGCYQLRITPKGSAGSRQKCSSKTFVLKTNLKKTLLSNSLITIGTQHYSERSELLVNLAGLGLNYAEIIIVKIIKGRSCKRNANASGWILSKQFDQLHNLEINESSCNCKWYKEQLECIFYISLNGTFCVQIEFVDIRCAPDTLWTHNGNLCRWCFDLGHFNLPINEINSKSVLIIESKTVNNSCDILLLAVCCICLCCILSFLIWSIYLKVEGRNLKIREVNLDPDYSKEPLRETQSLLKEIKNRKVLLLYARECQPFMNTVAEFRRILQDCLNLEIYDAWDVCNEDSISENIATWPLKYLSDMRIKVILIASNCSRLIHDALICGYRVNYIKRFAFDCIFPSALSHLLRSETDYTRVFVLRFDGDDFELQTFQFINPKIVYTLPQQLTALVTAIYEVENEAEIFRISSFAINKLTELVKELNSYKALHPNYAESILHINYKNSSSFGT